MKKEIDLIEVNCNSCKQYKLKRVDGNFYPYCNLYEDFIDDPADPCMDHER